ncbi:hypothetical protein BRADI_3g38598v3 [Brachypodium distachyon]|uniref:Uncharacterized protein n=1 Tax=Brachypodium distachyon TaxID=15368 RepID=A0A0Q3HYN6_BRADI|nr:hypothetical protein BRADI_3g38598v3 [Brachypodium distachyon]
MDGQSDSMYCMFHVCKGCVCPVQIWCMSKFISLNFGTRHKLLQSDSVLMCQNIVCLWSELLDLLCRNLLCRFFQYVVVFLYY